MLLLNVKSILEKTRHIGLRDKIASNASLRWYSKHSSIICDKFYFKVFQNLSIKNFVECGANNAEASRFLSNLGINTIAIEANPVSYKKLTSVDAENYSTLNVGLSNQEGALDFYIPQNNELAGNATFSPNSYLDYNKVSVPVTTIDKIAYKYKLFGSKTALWIDVEGFQKKVLQGAILFLKDPSCVLIKIETETQDLFENNFLAEDIDAFLLDFGFECVLCDHMSQAQCNAFYVKKDYINLISESITHYKNILKNSKMPIADMLFYVFFPILSKAKKILIKLIGPRLGNIIAARLGSRESKLFRRHINE